MGFSIQDCLHTREGDWIRLIWRSSYVSAENSTGITYINNISGVEQQTERDGSRPLDYNYRDEEYTQRFSPVWRESHMNTQIDIDKRLAYPGIAGIAFINHISEIRWMSHRGGSRSIPDVWDAYRDYYPGLPIWENLCGTFLSQILDRFAGGMGRLLISNRGGTEPETRGSRDRTGYMYQMTRMNILYSVYQTLWIKQLLLENSKESVVFKDRNIENA